MEVLMACRIGITTDLQSRKAYWKRQHPTLKNWKVITSKPLRREKAQAIETHLANQHGCQAHHGGNDPDSPWWFVYYFEY
jgi:hypothetical protein